RSRLSISVFWLTLRLVPRSTLFPYTTRSRSVRRRADLPRAAALQQGERPLAGPVAALRQVPVQLTGEPSAVRVTRRGLGHWAGRSEEHTSELQSRENLVCRLLLQKKKNSVEQ